MYLLLLLLGVFVVGFLVVLPNVEKFRGDERFYTDAAIQMLQTGDYWTPVFADGRVRLHKPVLTYWAVAGPFRFFGISLFTARIVSLAAAALTLWLTFKLALLIFSSRLTALISTTLIASNQELMTLATRATPDAMLCLFILVSMYGFAAIWFEPHPNPAAAWLALGGMALAVETKGLLGLSPLAANALYWLWIRPDVTRTRRLANWPAILFSLGIGLAWYVIMIHRHGFDGLQLFFDDQVGEKVSHSPWDILVNFATYLTAPLISFLPWSLLLPVAVVASRREAAEKLRNQREALVFLICLFVVLVAGFSLGNMRRTRYLLAAYPTLAVLLAPFVGLGMNRPIFQGLLRTGVKWGALAAVLGGAVLLMIGLKASLAWVVAGIIMTGLGAAGILIARTGHAVWGTVWVGVLCILTFVISNACLRHAIGPSPLPVVAAALQQGAAPDQTVRTWQVSDGAAAQLRLLSAGGLRVGELEGDWDEYGLAPGTLILTTSPHQRDFEQAGYEMRPIKSSNRLFSAFPGLGSQITKLSFSRRLTHWPEYWILREKPPVTERMGEGGPNPWR